MTKRHKNFGRPSQDKPVEDLSFELYDEEFECRPKIQGATLIQFVKAADSGDGAAAAQAILDFFRRVLQPESYERFEELINDPDRIVDVEDLGEIVSWLVEQYTDRPTQRSKGSSNS